MTDPKELASRLEAFTQANELAANPNLSEGCLLIAEAAEALRALAQPVQPVAWFNSHSGDLMMHDGGRNGWEDWTPLYTAPPTGETVTLKKRISEILSAAISGREKRYRLDETYIRWGLVEKEIHAAIDASPEEKK